MNIQKDHAGSAISKNGLKAILVPTDFSEYSDMALRAALEIAKQQNARIYLLHITRAQQIAAEKEKMQSQINRLPDAKSVEIVPDIRKGIPYEEILRVQTEKEIDLIIIDSHQQAPLKYLFMRSLAERVMEKVKCSVIVVGS
jgi:universal stress protein A